MIFAGIDPGINGAVAIIKEDGSVKTIRAPRFKAEKGMKAFDLAAYASIGAMLGGMKAEVAVESIHAFPGQGAVSMFTQGYGLALWRGVLAAHLIVPKMITPQAWRKSFWESGSIAKEDRKKVSIKKANELFPRLDIKHDGEAEALLLALHLKRTMAGNDFEAEA